MPISKNRVASSSDGANHRTAPSRADIRRELETVLESREFRGSQRGQMLLRSLVENALEGSVEQLKERTIGVELFHRDASYDTGQDAIVRVAANDVRKRLAAHYQQADPAQVRSGVRISLPPGSYVPEFKILSELHPTPVEEVRPPSPATAPRYAKPHRTWIPWVTTGLLAIICVLLAVQNTKLRADKEQPDHFAALPWSQIGSPGTAVTLIAADSNFSLYKELTHADQSLLVYTSGRWVDDLAARMPLLPDLSRMPFTSIGEAYVAGLVGNTLKTGGRSVAVRSGRMVEVDDFKSDRPVILVGSAYANPWVSLLNERLNFHIDYDPVSQKQICKNAAPRPGELPEYIGTARTPMAGIGYAIIALVPNLSHMGFVLIIAGTNMEGTEAAGELVTDIPRLVETLRKRGIDPAGRVEQLEILLRLDHLGAQSRRSEIIAHRVIPATATR